jgi:N-acetylneuraminate synthase/N,N'-diacetyllegionaminate synthase
MRKTTVIAEAGVNHNGDLDLAKKLIDTAAEAGADFVKFQTFKAEKLVSNAAKKAEYQKNNQSDSDDSQFSMLKKLELDLDMHQILFDYTSSKNIQFLSTPFDLDSVSSLNELGINIFKIPSGEITNVPFIRKIGSFGKPVILSTGMSGLGEIEKAIDQLIETGLDREKITVLHCNTQYPTPFEDVNLRAMVTIAAAFNVDIGYSDHTLGIEVPVAAVALGARVIEKHFTLDRNLPGPDHRASLEPDELHQMIKSIRNIELALGSSIKHPTPSEISNRDIVRKSIHLARDKARGEIISNDDLEMLRPGDGISPIFYDAVVGRKITQDLSAGHKIEWKDLN